MNNDDFHDINAFIFGEQTIRTASKPEKTLAELHKDLLIAIHSPCLYGMDARLKTLEHGSGIRSARAQEKPPMYLGSFVEEE